MYYFCELVQEKLILNVYFDLCVSCKSRVIELYFVEIMVEGFTLQILYTKHFTGSCIV